MAKASVDGSSSAVERIDSSAYKLLVSCPQGISRHQLSVIFEEVYDRVPHPDAELEYNVNELWDLRVQQNKSLYNGMKFRYGGHSLQTEHNFKKDSKISLHLGLTDYRTFVGTNLNPSWAKFLVSSDDIAVRCRHMSSPLGNGAIIETPDDKILMLQRSNNVGEFPGFLVFPGGHPEPKEVSISSHQCDRDLDLGLVNEKISEEMFDSIIREVVEEIGVPAECLSDPIFIGISLREMNVRPAAFFYIKCSLSPEAIDHFYNGAQDGYESTKLLAVSKTDACEWTSRMPGCHQGGYALYKLMLMARKDATTSKSLHLIEGRGALYNLHYCTSSMTHLWVWNLEESRKGHSRRLIMFYRLSLG
ncbi:unnamed protein product [Rhodiola kirilowii]